MPGCAATGNAETRRHGRLRTARLVSRNSRYRHAQLLCPVACVLGSAARQKECKLLTSEAPEDVVLAQMNIARRHGALQHEVPGCVTILVVDLFEVVQIAKNDAQMLAA